MGAGLALASLAFIAAGFHSAGLDLKYRTPAMQVARDGVWPTPPPRPSPTPTPIPPAFRQCYGSRPADAGGFDLLPAAETSVLSNCQVVAYYGYPGIPGLGVLGKGTSEEMIARLKAQAAEFDAVNGSRSVVPALQLIVAVAQPDAQGAAIWRMPTEVLEGQLALAKANDLLVILDDQVGHSTAEAEVASLLPNLLDPRVHLAVDPEWSLPIGTRPGDEIGGLDAADINRAQALMQEYITANRLSNKMLIVHQFTPDMIRNKEELQRFPNVDLVIDMDGFGGQGIKLAHYQQFVAADGAPHGGMKLFYDPALDTNLFTPAEASAISPQPDVIIYQ